MESDNIVDLLRTYWYLVAAILLGGAFLGELGRKLVRKGWKNLSTKAPLIKMYWQVVTTFVLISLIIYSLVYYFSESENLGSNLSALGQLLTLLFAIFVGNFAFQQVSENRFDKLAERGHNSFKNTWYLHAIRYYEEAHSINPKDFSVLSELLEVYLVLQNYQKFEAKITHLESLKVEDYEEAILHYLKVAKFLLKEELGSANKEIENFLKTVEKNPAILKYARWEFSEIKKSDVFNSLKGDAKKIFNNFVAYFGMSLSEGKKREFEKGNFTLSGLEGN